MTFQLSVVRKLTLIFLFSTLLTSCGEVKQLSFAGFEAPKSWEDLVAIGQSAEKSGKVDVAEKCFQQAIDACAKKYGEDDGRTATCVGYLAKFYMDKQEWKLCYEQYKRWKTIMQKVAPNSDDMKQIDADMQKVKAKMKQYGLVPDDVLKKRMEKQKAEEAKEKDSSAAAADEK